MISIHAPREGCDIILPLLFLAVVIFQSTHPVRGATRPVNQLAPVQGGISIHAPREGCDAVTADKIAANSVFQSTHPVRGAT